MEKPTNRKWASIALLSILVPVSLLTTFRLTGILKEPPNPETITVEAETWNMSRNLDIIDLDVWVKNSYTVGVISTELRIHPIGVYKNESDWPAWGGDLMKLRVVTASNVSGGFIYSLVIKFSQIDAQSRLYIETDPDSINLQNLKTRNICDVGTYKQEAYFEAISFNQPKNISLSTLTLWPFFDKNNTDHWITVSLETIFFNGAVYKKVVMQILLGVLMD